MSAVIADVRDINKAKNKQYLLVFEKLPYINKTKRSEIETKNHIIPCKKVVKNGIGKKSKNQLKIKFLTKLANLKKTGKVSDSICIFPFGFPNPFLYIMAPIKKKIKKAKIPNKKSDFFLLFIKLDVKTNGKNKQVLFERYAAIVDKYEKFLLLLLENINDKRMKKPIKRSFLCASQIYGMTHQGKILQIVITKKGRIFPKNFLVKKYTKMQFPKCKNILMK